MFKILWRVTSSTTWNLHPGQNGKVPAYPASCRYFQLRLLLLPKCTRCSKSKQQLKGLSTSPLVSQTPVILKMLVTHARQASFCPCYLLSSTHSFWDSTKMSPTRRISYVPSLEVEAPTFCSPGPLFMLLSQVTPHCNRALLSPSHSVWFP